MFQFTRFALNTYTFSIEYPAGWVAPFGNPKIKACYRLLRAYRRLPRPSSPLDAKTSAMCPWARDHSDPTSSNRHEPFSGMLMSHRSCALQQSGGVITNKSSTCSRSALLVDPNLQASRTKIPRGEGGVDRQIVSNHAVVKERLVALYPQAGCHFAR